MVVTAPDELASGPTPIMASSMRRHDEAHGLLLAGFLPPELLLEVFLLVRTPCFGQRGRPSWLAVKDVCRYWRTAALESQTLWSCIGPWDVNTLKLCISRAGSSPLSLICHFGDTEDGPGDGGSAREVQKFDLELLENYSERFEYVDVTLTLDEMAFLIQNVENSWENVRHLVLRVADWDHRHDDPSYGPLILGDMPPHNLMHLELCYFAPDMGMVEPQSYQHLHTLHLRGLNEARFPGTGELLSILENCLLVEDLHISARRVYSLSIQAPDFDTYDDRRIIPLNHLRKVTLGLKHWTATKRLLSHLVIPERAHTFLAQHYASHEPGPLSMLPDDLSNLKSLHDIGCMSLTFHDNGEYTLCTTTVDGSPRLDIGTTFSHLTPTPVNEFLPIVFRQLSRLPLSSLRMLYFRHMGEGPYGDDFRRVLLSLPSLEALELQIKETQPPRVCARTIRQLFSTLSVSPPQSEARNSRRSADTSMIRGMVPTPRLLLFGLHDVEVDDVLNREVLKDLFACLQSREDAMGPTSRDFILYVNSKSVYQLAAARWPELKQIKGFHSGL